MMTKRRLNLRRNNDRLVVAAPSAAEPTKLPPLSAVSTNSSKFSSNLAGRFYTDNSFEAHSREREREVGRSPLDSTPLARLAQRKGPGVSY